MGDDIVENASKRKVKTKEINAVFSQSELEKERVMN